MDPNRQAAPSTARVPPAPAGLGPGDLARITSAAADARAPHTRRTYAVQWARFAAWAEARGLPPRPAPPAAVAAYLTARASTAKVATVRLSAAAIGAAHRATGHPVPTTAPLVRAVIAGIARQHAQHPDTAPRQAAALTYDQTVRLMAGATQPRRSGRGTESAALAAGRGLVDAALVALAFCAGLRRSEITALRWQDVTETAQPGQLRVRVRQSKTNPDGARADDRLLVQGFAAALTALRDATAPAATGRVIPLSPSQVNRRLQALAASAGLAGVSSHSGRRGLASELIRRGASTAAVQQAGGWRDPQMVARYASAVRVETGAVARYFG